MDKNYFGLVCEAISQANRIKNFKKIKKDESNFEFQANEKHYLINLDSQKKLIILNIIDDENNSSKNLSSWLFDEDVTNEAYHSYIKPIFSPKPNPLIPYTIPNITALAVLLISLVTSFSRTLNISLAT